MRTVEQASWWVLIIKWAVGIGLGVLLAGTVGALGVVWIAEDGGGLQLWKPELKVESLGDVFLGFVLLLLVCVWGLVVIVVNFVLMFAPMVAAFALGFWAVQVGWKREVDLAAIGFLLDKIPWGRRGQQRIQEGQITMSAPEPQEVELKRCANALRKLDPSLPAAPHTGLKEWSGYLSEVRGRLRRRSQRKTLDEELAYTRAFNEMYTEYFKFLEHEAREGRFVAENELKDLELVRDKAKLELQTEVSNFKKEQLGKVKQTPKKPEMPELLERQLQNEADKEKCIQDAKKRYSGTISDEDI